MFGSSVPDSAPHLPTESGIAADATPNTLKVVSPNTLLGAEVLAVLRDLELSSALRARTPRAL
jgi:hypothetical protein